MGLVLAAAVAGGCVCAEAAAASETPGKALAGALTHATGEVRERSLLALLRKSGLTVLDTRGKAIIRGVAGPRDFYFYEPEVQYLSDETGLKPAYSVAALASLVSQATGRSLSADRFATALRQGFRSAVTGTASGRKLLEAVVDELSLYQPGHRRLDSALTSTTELSPVQAVLLLADLGTPAGRRRTSHATRDAPQAVAAGGECEGVEEKEEAEGQSVGPVIKDILKAVGVAASWPIRQVPEAAHAAALFHEVDVTVSQKRYKTHYGPAGHAPDAGQPLEFRIHVHSRLKRGPTYNCGQLAGLKMPTNDVAGVHVDWPGNRPANYRNLAAHTTITAASSTDNNGNALLSAVPLSESVPGVGATDHVAGQIIPYLSFNKFGAKGLPAGLINSLLNAAVGVPEAFNFLVSWHQATQAAFSANRTAVGKDYDADPALSQPLLLTTFDTNLNFTATIPLTTTTEPDGSVVATGTGPFTLAPGPEVDDTTDDLTGCKQSLISWTPGTVEATVQGSVDPITGTTQYTVSYQVLQDIMGTYDVCGTTSTTSILVGIYPWVEGQPAVYSDAFKPFGTDGEQRAETDIESSNTAADQENDSSTTVTQLS